jgi:hypothetical protein
MWPQQPGQYMSGPNGMQGNQAVVAMQGFGVRRAVGGNAIGQMHGGMLFGKFGEDGEVFFIGERYEGSPETEGPLLLHIGPSPWQVASSGSYEVKVERKR